MVLEEAHEVNEDIKNVDVVRMQTAAWSMLKHVIETNATVSELLDVAKLLRRRKRRYNVENPEDYCMFSAKRSSEAFFTLMRDLNEDFEIKYLVEEKYERHKANTGL